MENRVETVLPRVLAVVQLFVSMMMFGIIIYLAVRFGRGRPVSPRAWAFPFVILIIDWVLIALLSRKQLSFRLYMGTIVLWLVTTGYYVVNLRALL
ncbi:MAG TPA: hypothetical protein VJ853_10775, partial [Thermoanaerobaculia bacterium]|nr:hypothetical protein [Thermoanaerobaculia bacterium]